MKRVILFGTICLALVLASSVMARHAEPEEVIFHQALPGLDDVHGYNFAKSRGDTLYLLGGREETAPWANVNIFFDGHGQPLPVPYPRWRSGKFEDPTRGPSWTLWDRSHMWTGMLPSGTIVTPRPGFDRTFTTDSNFSVTADDGGPTQPTWDPSLNPDGVDLRIQGNTFWWGIYAPDTWGQPAGSNYKEPGYGNDWNDVLRCIQAVNPGLDVVVNWEYDIQHEIEFNWDWIYVQYWDVGANAWVTVHSYTGVLYPAPPVPASHTFTLTPAQHQGTVQLRYQFLSDSSWSDQDGLYPTERGGAQLDNISVTYSEVGGVVHSHFQDFESFTPAPPGSQAIFGNWHVVLSYGVGNYAQLWQDPGHLSDCQFNTSWQAIFVNDGQYAPDVPPYSVGPRTYGPGGFMVDPLSGITGRLEGNTTPIFSGVVSPVFALYEVDAAGNPVPNGIQTDNLWLQFDCYRDMGIHSTDGWTFYRFSMRSTPDAPHTIDDYDWATSGFYYGGPDHIRSTFGIGTWPEPGARYAQIGLWTSQFRREGNFSTPAPYFDNVTLIGFPTTGPSVSADAVTLAQDNFPPVGLPNTKSFDASDPQYRIRWDRAWDINPRDQAVNYPGDSITVSVTPVRAGYEHHPTKLPRAYVTVKANPLFADVSHGGPRDYSQAVPAVENIVGPDANYIYTFEMPGQPTVNVNVFWFDMDGPKTTGYQIPTAPVFFPGDIIHYYFKAYDYNPLTDDEGETTWPANLNWFGNFEGYNAATGESGRWSNEFTTYGLPSLYNDPVKGITQPEILWVNAFWTRGGENEWYPAFKNAGYQPWGTEPVQGEPWDDPPVYFDQYHVNRPDNVGGNHIGGRVREAYAQSLLGGYNAMVFSFGNLRNSIMGTGEEEGGSYVNKATCIQSTRAWLGMGGKTLILTGDALAESNDSYEDQPTGKNFNSEVMGVNYVSRSIRDVVGGQVAPLARTIAGTNVLDDCRCWVVNGGCPSINHFDQVTALSGAIDFAEFGTQDSVCGGSFAPYATSLASAGIANTYQPDPAFPPSYVRYMPYDLMYVRGFDCYNCGDPYVSMRSKILMDFLLDIAPGQITSVTPDAGVLMVSNFPNPFNPATTIKLSLPRPGEVSLKVYNVRGELVRTLVNDVLVQGNHDIIWDGTNDRGAQTASGIYFYEVRTGGEVKVGKMALVK